MGARATAACPKPDETKPDVAEGKPPQQLTSDKTSRIDWASLLKRVFQIDILACAKCGGRMKVTAVIEQPDVVTKILGHLGMPTVPEDGTFVDFCEHVQSDLHLPMGRAIVAHIREAHGVRTAKSRGRNTKDEVAQRGAFRTFFAGAQWVGDGMQVPVVVDGERFVFNLELNVDAHTGAHVGASIREEEDSVAVVEALKDGAVTSGALPVALLLDNKPSKHTAEVDTALDGAIRIRATTERTQNKAHVEGAFGLFSQVLADLVLNTKRTAHDIAHALLVLVVTIQPCCCTRRRVRDSRRHQHLRRLRRSRARHDKLSRPQLLARHPCRRTHGTACCGASRLFSHCRPPHLCDLRRLYA